MGAQTFKSRAIYAGYEWRLRLSIKGVGVFPSSATFRAQVRSEPSDETALTTLTTGDGTISRVSPDTLDIIIPGAASQDWRPGLVHLDVVRTDTSSPEHLGFRLSIPVHRAITSVA